MARELEALERLILIDKSNISPHLKNLGEENLTFPRHELLPFLRDVDNEVQQFTADDNPKKYPTKFFKMCRFEQLNTRNRLSIGCWFFGNT